MKKILENEIIFGNRYDVSEVRVKGVYRKLKFYENHIDITNEIIGKEIFNLLLGKLSIAKIHHLTPRYVLNKWLGEDKKLREFNIDIKKDKYSFTEKSFIFDEKKNKKKINEHLKYKFSSLHTYTFNIDNYIVIFEDGLLFLIEDFIKYIIKYIENYHEKSKNRMKDLEISINGKKINFTEKFIKDSSFNYNGKLINLNEIDNCLYNKIISIKYTHVLLHIISMINHDLFFKTLYLNIDQNLIKNTIEDSILFYFFMCLNQTEQELEIALKSKNFITGFVTANKDGFALSEFWKEVYMDKNNSLSIFIPLTPKYGVLFSKDNESFNNFLLEIHKGLDKKKYLNNQINSFKLEIYNKTLEKKGKIYKNNNYTILLPTINWMKTKL